MSYAEHAVAMVLRQVAKKIGSSGDPVSYDKLSRIFDEIADRLSPTTKEK